MTTHPVTLELPELLYRRILQRATVARHAVEDELTIVLEGALTEVDSALPTAVDEELEQLQFLDDASLWRAAQITVPAASDERLEQLAEKRELTGLTSEEHLEIEQLLGLADRVMLIRAEAAALLKGRGNDVSRLVGNRSKE
jgi:hypothetical protein